MSTHSSSSENFGSILTAIVIVASAFLFYASLSIPQPKAPSEAQAAVQTHSEQVVTAAPGHAS